MLKMMSIKSNVKNHVTDKNRYKRGVSGGGAHNLSWLRDVPHVKQICP